MKCPKCGYNSFEYLETCKKCGQGLGEHKQKFNLWGFFAEQEPPAPSSAEPEPESANPAPDENEPDNDLIDFGFDFLDDIDGQNDQKIQQEALSNSDNEISIYQPFDDNNENVPDDNNLSDSSDSNDKPEKGPEFAF